MIVLFYRRIFLFTLVFLAAWSGSALAQSRFDTAAPYAIMVEAATGEVLFEKNADVPFPPASMAKIMTTYLAFEMIANGEVSLDDTTIVADETWRQWNNQGSTMFLKARDEVTIADLLRGIMVLAEALAGSETLFVEWMNAKADELGLRDSVYMTSNGWPAEGQVVTARDLAMLSYYMISNFPELYKMYAQRNFTYGVDLAGNPITQRNRNPLLGRVDGADGLKTGHTDEAGYGLTGSAQRGDRRIIIVLSGLTSIRQRTVDSRSLINYGFNAYKTYSLFKAGDVVEDAAVWLGEEGKVPLVVDADVAITLSRSARNRMLVKLVYQSPIPAPIEAGQDIAHLVISTPGAEDRIIPLTAGRAVEEIGSFGRLGALFSYLIFGNTATN